MTLTATNDLRLAYTPQADGSILVDFVKTAQGDFAQVAGAARLVQDVNRIFLMLVGANPFRPSEGDPLFNEIGRPQSSDMVTLITGIIEQIEAYMITTQQQAASLGFRALDDMLASFQNIVVSEVAPSGSGAYSASLLVVSRAGVSVAYTAPTFVF